MALYNNPYQYSFGVPGQMNQFQQQPVQMPAQPVQQPQQNNNGILWVSGEVGAKSYLVAPGTNALQAQLANCCCETREAIQGVNYNMAQNTCALQNTMNSNTRDIIDNQNANARAVLDYLCNEKISSLQAENNDLRRAASQDRQSALLTTAMASQTQQLINAINPAPIPAYQVPNPNTYYGCGCGCNTGCNC